jgi:hypothetical protein
VEEVKKSLIEHDGYNPAIKVIQGGNVHTCACYTVDDDPSGEITYCPLHGSAPQMLEALETILNEFDRQDPTPGFVLAMAAIKAARGE